MLDHQGEPWTADPVVSEPFGAKPYVMVGQAPSRRGDPLRPVVGYAERLAELAGMTPEGIRLAFDFANCLDEWPGAHKHGDMFPMDAARVGASKLMPRLLGRRVVLLGRGVARAFGMPPMIEWGTWCRMLMGTWHAAVFPHPSGRNRFWNDEAEARRMGLWLRDVVADAHREFQDQIFDDREAGI